MESLLGTHRGLQRILMKDELKMSGRTGAGRQGLSLTGSWSCTTDSMDIDGRDGGLGTGKAGQRVGRKGQTANAFH